MGKKGHAFMMIHRETETIEWRTLDGRTGSDPLTASALGALVWMLVQSGVTSINFREGE
jgi:hypothetical protein